MTKVWSSTHLVNILRTDGFSRIHVLMRVVKHKPTSVRLTVEVVAALHQFAEREERSVAWCVDSILRKHFESTGELEPKARPRPRGQPVA